MAGQWLTSGQYPCRRAHLSLPDPGFLAARRRRRQPIASFSADCCGGAGHGVVAVVRFGRGDGGAPVRRVDHHNLGHPHRGLRVLFSRAGLSLSRSTLNYATGVVRRHRKAIGGEGRALTPGGKRCWCWSTCVRARRSPSSEQVSGIGLERVAVCERDSGAAVGPLSQAPPGPVQSRPRPVTPDPGRHAHRDRPGPGRQAVPLRKTPAAVGVGSGRGFRVSLDPFPRPAPPNRTCDFHRIRLSTDLRLLGGFHCVDEMRPWCRDIVRPPAVADDRYR